MQPRRAARDFKTDRPYSRMLLNNNRITHKRNERTATKMIRIMMIDNEDVNDNDNDNDNDRFSIQTLLL